MKKKRCVVVDTFYGPEMVGYEVAALEKGEDEECGRKREEVMDKIGLLMTWCYEHRINYIEILQKVFPRYEWKSLKFDETSEADTECIHKALAKNDFAWYYQSAVMVARSRRRTKYLRIAWVSQLMYEGSPAQAPRLFINTCKQIIPGTYLGEG